MDNNIESNINNVSNITNQVQKKQSKKYLIYFLVFLFLMVVNFLMVKNGMAIFIGILIFLLLVIVLFLRRVVARGKIVSRLKFYSSLVMVSVIGIFLLPSLIIGFISSRSQEPLGLGGIAIYAAILVLIIILIFVSAIFYEVTRYFVFKKVNENYIKEDILNDSIIKTKRTSIGGKFFSVMLFFSSFLFLYDYLKVFINNHNYVKSLSFVSNLSDYGLANLSIKDVFTTSYIYLIYFFIFISILAVIISFKNSKLVGIVISTALLVFIFLFIFKIMIGSHHQVYFNTVYQEGSPYNGGAIDIIKSDNAIKAKDISLCSKVEYYAYRGYCEKILSPSVGSKTKK